MMRTITLTLGAILVATVAASAQPVSSAQPAPQVATSTAPGGPDADMPAPPHPGGPRGPRGGDHAPPPPPPRGASIHLDRGQDGAARVDVRCSERDTTKDCADVAGQLLDKLATVARTK